MTTRARAGESDLTTGSFGRSWPRPDPPPDAAALAELHGVLCARLCPGSWRPELGICRYAEGTLREEPGPPRAMSEAPDGTFYRARNPNPSGLDALPVVVPLDAAGWLHVAACALRGGRAAQPPSSGGRRAVGGVEAAVQGPVGTRRRALSSTCISVRRTSSGTLRASTMRYAPSSCAITTRTSSRG